MGFNKTLAVPTGQQAGLFSYGRTIWIIVRRAMCFYSSAAAVSFTFDCAKQSRERRSAPGNAGDRLFKLSCRQGVPQPVDVKTLVGEEAGNPAKDLRKAGTSTG